jgi:hypothetical protein
VIAVTGKTWGRWSTERKERARDSAERLGRMERGAQAVAERAVNVAVDAAQTPVGTGVLVGCAVLLGSLTDVRF